MTDARVRTNTIACVGILILLSAIAADPQPKDVDAKTALDSVLHKLNARGIPLPDAFDFLKDISHVKQIEINWDALEKAGVSRQTSVNLQANDEKLSVVLDRLLNSLHSKQPLGYRPDGDTIRISTKADLKTKK